MGIKKEKQRWLIKVSDGRLWMWKFDGEVELETITRWVGEGRDHFTFSVGASIAYENEDGVGVRIGAILCDEDGLARRDQGDPAFLGVTYARPWDGAPLFGPLLFVQREGPQFFGLEDDLATRIHTALHIMGYTFTSVGDAPTEVRKDREGNAPQVVN